MGSPGKRVYRLSRYRGFESHPLRKYSVSNHDDVTGFKMVESMTGFGRGEVRSEDILVEVEVRSVNNRFCDVSVRLPRHLGEFEYDVQQIVKKAVGRGKINVNVRVEHESDGTTDLKVDKQLAASYRALLDELREAARIDEAVKLEHLLTFSDVFVRNEDDNQSQRTWAVVREALTLGLKAFREMRLAEGAALATDLNERLDKMAEALVEVAARAPARVDESVQKLRSRIATLVEDVSVDESRLAAEIAFLSDKLDITEECVRLDSHIDAFRQALNGSDSEGRKLNFLTQEMHREVNTIGSKANDVVITQMSVQLKEELEKIREQVQNIQ
jgi:uncharacterized protein (TIGR00255 family)